MSHDDTQPPPADSAELIRRAQGGDQQALDAVLARYYPRVLGMVRARLGQGMRRYLDSADVVQEAMGEAVRSLRDYEDRGEEALTRWLGQLVENRIRDSAKFHRAQKRDPGELFSLRGPSASQDTGSFVRVADSTLGPGERAERREDEKRVAAALQTLPERERRVLELRAHGQPWEAIAQAVGLEGADRARHLHGRAKLVLARALAREEQGGAGGGA